SAVLDGGSAGHVLLDLSLLATADAIGVKSLMDAAQAYPNAALAVLAPTAHIRRVLDQSGVGEVLPIVRGRQQALAALAGPAHLRLAPTTIAGRLLLQDLLFVDERGVVYLGRELDTQAPLRVRVVAGQPADPVRQLLVAQLHAW